MSTSISRPRWLDSANRSAGDPTQPRATASDAPPTTTTCAAAATRKRRPKRRSPSTPGPPWGFAVGSATCGRRRDPAHIRRTAQRIRRLSPNKASNDQAGHGLLHVDADHLAAPFGLFVEVRERLALGVGAVCDQ